MDLKKNVDHCYRIHIWLITHFFFWYICQKHVTKIYQFLKKDIEYKNVHHKVFEFQALSNVKFSAKMDTIKVIFI